MSNSDNQPHAIVPDGVDAVELRQRKRGRGTTPPDELKRCPDCGSAVLRPCSGRNQGAFHGSDTDHDWRCNDCGARWRDHEVRRGDGDE